MKAGTGDEYKNTGKMMNKYGIIKKNVIKMNVR